MIIPVIMCGGAGTRLWPLSRDHRPKPLLPLLGGASTLSATIERVADPALCAAPLIVANRDHRYMIAEAMAAAGCAGQQLLEPAPRDTTAAIAAAVQWVAARDPEAVLLVLAADHLIRDVAGFRRTVAEAYPAAAAGEIVTFGIRPTHPSTGYGYIRRGPALSAGHGVYRVEAFVEKPDAETARRHLAAGNLWNSGNFMMRASVALAELRAGAADVLAVVAEAIAGARPIDDGAAMLADTFRGARAISFDHAVMERTARAAVIDAGFDWSDLGTWGAVWEAADKDDRQNAAQGRVTLVSASGNYVSSDGTAIGLIGVDDLVVVASDDTVLVAPRGQSDSVKALVAAVGRADDRSAPDRRRHYRPWGHYRSIDVGAAHEVRRLEINPGQRLSLHVHRHRSEHWTVVSGEAEVTVGGEAATLGPSGSIHVPAGTVHRAANRGAGALVMIEVQCGRPLGEDDVVRFEDDYGRVPPPA